MAGDLSFTTAKWEMTNHGWRSLFRHYTGEMTDRGWRSCFHHSKGGMTDDGGRSRFHHYKGEMTDLNFSGQLIQFY